MPLKAVVENLEDVQEEFRTLYVPDGETYALDLDGVEDHPGTQKLVSAHQRQKKANTDAKHEIEALAARLADFADLDPAEAKAALAQMAEFEGKRMVDESRFDELLTRQTAELREDHETRLKDKDARIAELERGLSAREGELAEIKIFTAIRDAALAKGVKPSALDDVVNRARPVWTLRDGRPLPIRPGGGEPIFGRDGEIMSVAEWVDTLAGAAVHLFEPNQGAGAPGGEAARAAAPVRTLTREEAGDHVGAIARGKAVIRN